MDELNGIARVEFHSGNVGERKRLSEATMETVRTRAMGEEVA
jgi:hypothetical protein